MATMTPEQITAELQRKKNAGLTPTSQANVAQYNNMTAQPAASEQAKTEYFNNNYGGTDNYAANQNKRYADAVSTGNADLIKALQADSQRVGYALGTPQEKVSGPSAQDTQQTYIDGIANARRQQVMADLAKSRDSALSNLAGEKSAIAPKYYDQRNQAAAGSQQTARNLAEYMAARGGANSGSNAQMELSRNMSLQGNLGSLGRQETADFSDIERRTTGVKNAYESDLVSANSGLEADRMNALLQEYQNEQQRQLQLAGLMGVYNGQKTLQGQQFDYSQTRDKVSDNQWQQQYDLNKQLSDRDFNYQVGRDDISDSQWAQQFAESVRQSGIDNALASVKASSSGSGGTKDLSLAQKISIWKISGKAPEGIPGVTPGAKVYDEVAARKAAENSGGVNLWNAIKGVISKVGTVASGLSDSDISEYVN